MIPSDRSQLWSRGEPLTDEEVAAHDEIKAKASELETLFERFLTPGRYRSLSITALETSVMWAVKALTL